MSVTPTTLSNNRRRLFPSPLLDNGPVTGICHTRSPVTFHLSKNSIIVLQSLLNDLEHAGSEHVLRTLRNKILGHEALKHLLIKEWDLVGKLLPFLQPSASATQQREAAIIFGSLAHNPTAELTHLIKAQIPQALLRLALTSSHGDEKLKESILRALRSIYRHPDAPRDLPFQHQELLSVLVSQLQSPQSMSVGPMTKIAECAAIVLANCCDSLAKQQTLLSLGIIPMILQLLQKQNIPASTLEALLDLIAAITRDFPDSCRALVASSIHEPGLDTISFMFGLLGKKQVVAEIRILAAICLCNLFRAGLLLASGKNEIVHGTTTLDGRVAKILLPTLASLLQTPQPRPECSQVRAKAAEVLALLMSESEPLQMVACDGGVISKLAHMLEVASSTPNFSEGHHAVPCTEEEKRAALLALAALSSFKEECRKLVIEAKILPAIVTAMESPIEGVRSAACQCTRSLSRSVKNLRTALVDAGMIQPLMHLLKDSSVDVQKSACASLCNLVLDFSPMKEAVVKEGGVERLVEMTLSADPEMRLNSLWALKNLLYQSETSIKLGTLEKLGVERIEQLADDSIPAIQEQTMNVLRNLVCEREEDVSEVLLRFPIARLVRLLERKMSNVVDANSSGNETPLRDEITLHSCYVIANACTASDSAPKDAIMASAIILDRLGSLLDVGGKVDLQTAALWCVINLTWTEDPGSADRISVLRRRGWERQLEMLLASHGISADVRDRVQTALNNFTAMHISPTLTHTTATNTTNNSSSRSRNNNNRQN